MLLDRNAHSKANLTAPTTIKNNHDVTTVFTHNMITKVEVKQTVQMRMTQMLTMMKSTHMRGAIAMRNHIIVIANQSMHMILTILEGVILNTEHNQTTMLESQVKQVSVHTATVKKKKRNSASSNS